MLVVTKAIGVLLQPPGFVIVLAVLGLLLQRRARYIGAALVWIGVAALAILSMPATGVALLQSLERATAPLATPYGVLAHRADAIVVLGGGRAPDAPEYGGDTVNTFTLERLRYAARLQRATGLPLLVSGGSVFGEAVPEAELMQRALVEDFRTSPKWIESRSRTTYENAIYSRAILDAAHVRRVLLVTHAWHMARAKWSFEHAGMDVIQAPTGFTNIGIRTALDYLPSSRGLSLSTRALNERLGLTWYRWRYGNVTEKQAATVARLGVR